MTPLERAARELCKLDGKDPGHPLIDIEVQPFSGPESTEPNWKGYVEQARAVLTAIREPSEGMVDAGHEALRTGEAGDPLRHEAESAWKDMIDAALAEGI